VTDAKCPQTRIGHHGAGCPMSSVEDDGHSADRHRTGADDPKATVVGPPFLTARGPRVLPMIVSRPVENDEPIASAQPKVYLYGHKKSAKVLPCH